MEDPRPDLGPALEAVLAAACTHVPALKSVQHARVLVVAGAALEHSRASIRSLAPWKVTVGGRRRLLEITLRPLFFLDANGPGRLATLVHELFHVSTVDGTSLADERRHGRDPAPFEADALRHARALWDHLPSPLLAALAHHGEVRLRAWRIRPGAALARRTFTDTHLFRTPVAMHTPAGQRSTWY